MNIFKIGNTFKYLEGVMIMDQRLTMRIMSVREEQIESKQGTEAKAVMYFHGSNKGLILNKTNIKRLVAMFGADTDQWLHNWVTIYAEKGNWFGRSGWAVRIDDKPAKPPAGTKSDAEAVADANADLFGDG